MGNGAMKRKTPVETLTIKNDSIRKASINSLREDQHLRNQITNDNQNGIKQDKQKSYLDTLNSLKQSLMERDLNDYKNKTNQIINKGFQLTDDEYKLIQSFNTEINHGNNHDNNHEYNEENQEELNESDDYFFNFDYDKYNEDEDEFEQQNQMFNGQPTDLLDDHLPSDRLPNDSFPNDGLPDDRLSQLNNVKFQSQDSGFEQPKKPFSRINHLELSDDDLIIEELNDLIQEPPLKR